MIEVKKILKPVDSSVKSILYGWRKIPYNMDYSNFNPFNLCLEWKLITNITDKEKTIRQESKYYTCLFRPSFVIDNQIPFVVYEFERSLIHSYEEGLFTYKSDPLYSIDSEN